MELIYPSSMCIQCNNINQTVRITTVKNTVFVSVDQFGVSNCFKMIKKGILSSDLHAAYLLK
jgi:hypothetical protein